VTADNNDVTADAALMRHRHHLDASVDCDKPLNLEMNKTCGVRSPHSLLTDRHSTPTYIASLCTVLLFTHIYKHYFGSIFSSA